jgi:hypothetical protein
MTIMTQTEWIASVQIVTLSILAACVITVWIRRAQRRALFELAVSGLIMKFEERRRTGTGKKEIEDILRSLSERPGRFSEREFKLIEAIRTGLDEENDAPTATILRELTKTMHS